MTDKLPPDVSPENFYHALPAFSRFNDLTEESHFQRIPPNWRVFVTDIAGSTEAIKKGRYRDVNTLGDACIVAAQNAIGNTDFPYVFGGDGATLLIPPHNFDQVAAALDGARKLARQRFGMTLRVGSVAVSELQSIGDAVKVAKFSETNTSEVAKYHLIADRFTAMFRGGGISRAEERVKADSETYEVPEDSRNVADLTGLSCRWKPVRSQKGRILSLPLSARSSDPKATYDRVLKKLDSILDGNIATANPIQLPNMGYDSLGRILNDEKRYHSRLLSLSFLRRAVEIILSVLVFRYHFPAVSFDAQRYSAAIKNHSDFRKFDDLLRMVVDCTDTQAADIRDFLEKLYRAKEICYGLHESDEALMTCIVGGFGDGEHIHFVDGGDGGYAMAAIQYKAQSKAASTWHRYDDLSVPA